MYFYNYLVCHLCYLLSLQLSEVSHKFEHLAGQSEDTHKVHRLDGKVRDLESKLELELTTRSRLEVCIVFISCDLKTATIL